MISGYQNTSYYFFINSEAVTTNHQNDKRFGMDFNLSENEILNKTSYYFMVPVSLQSCLDGEIFDVKINNSLKHFDLSKNKSLNCKVCDEGKYSKSKAICLDCEDIKTKCSKGLISIKPGIIFKDKIKIFSPGYWMELPFTNFENILECPELSSCM